MKDFRTETAYIIQAFGKDWDKESYGWINLSGEYRTCKEARSVCEDPKELIKLAENYEDYHLRIIKILPNVEIIE